VTSCSRRSSAASIADSTVGGRLFLCLCWRFGWVAFFATTNYDHDCDDVMFMLCYAATPVSVLSLTVTLVPLLLMAISDDNTDRVGTAELWIRPRCGGWPEPLLSVGRGGGRVQILVIGDASSWSVPVVLFVSAEEGGIECTLFFSC